MKEVLTKSFWQGVKKTYYEALEDSPPEKPASQDPADVKLSPDLTAETPPAASPSSEQH